MLGRVLTTQGVHIVLRVMLVLFKTVLELQLAIHVGWVRILIQLEQQFVLIVLLVHTRMALGHQSVDLALLGISQTRHKL
jgi:hypothetical protein